MADTFTTRLSLTKPEVGASADTWGTKLNANFDTLDGLFDAGPYLAVDAGGTGAGTAAGARTSLGLGTMATQNASNVAIDGGYGVFTSTFRLSSTAPELQMYESDAGTDEKYWRLVAADGLFYLQAMNDSNAGGATVIAVDRNGTTPTSIAFTATTVTVNGNAVWHAGNDGAGSGLDADTLDGNQASAFVLASEATSGSFTANLRGSDGGSVIASGTAYWKKFNGVVTLRLPALTTSGTETVLYIDSLPAAIRSSADIFLSCQGYNGNAGPVSVQVVSGDDILIIRSSDYTFLTSATATKGIFSTVLTWTV